MNNKSIIYQTGLYLRLSKEDGDVAEGSKLVSNSISNQKALIMDFLKSHLEIKVYSEYVDDGYSGVNFERPNFQRMLEDIRSGKINCVIVKDLSRFGRNYIEAGRYIEKIFPMLGVRFIAITDGYDSLESENNYGSDMVIPFKNLINDAYCRDISVKIRSHLEMKRKRGEYIGAFAVYGYLKDENNKNQLIADEYASGVVRDIYTMKLCGLSQQAIADKLNEDGILSPMEYKKSIGINLKSTFQKVTQARWTYKAVDRILKNEIYTGVLIQGKQTTPNYKVKKRVYKQEQEWSRVENAHEAIVSRYTFDLVQELLKVDTRISPQKEQLYPLSGLIQCGDCREAMVRKTVPAGGKKYVYYVCSGNKRDKTMCSPHRIAEADLNGAVLHLLQCHIRDVLTLEQAMKIVEQAPKRRADVAKFEERICKKRGELEKAEKRKLNLYEDLKDGIITQKEYMQLKAEYDRRIAEAETAIGTYEKEVRLILDNKSSMHEWIKEFLKFQNIQTLERNAAVVLIKQVIVYSADRVEVVFNFEDEFTRCKDYVAAYQAECERKEAV